MNKNKIIAPDHVKKKILMFFMRTSLPRILKEEAEAEKLLEKKTKDDNNECC